MAFLAACGSADAASGDFVIDTLAGGVVHVSSPEQGVWTGTTAWRAVEDLRIGSLEGADALAAPIQLEEDGLGRIYVLDAQEMQIRVFDPAGRHIRSFGRGGQGPGEFRQPIGMTWGPEGELWVADAANVRYSVFDTTGTFLRSYPRYNDFSMMPWPGIVDSAKRLYDVGIERRDERSVEVLIRYDSAFQRADTFPLPSHDEAQFEVVFDGGKIRNSVPVPYTPRMHWAQGANGVIWAGLSDRYRLELRRVDGSTVRIGERPYTPVKVEGAELDSLPRLLAGFTQEGGEIDLSAVPESKPAFISIDVDDRGFAWVRPSTPLAQRNAVFDVFDPEARYLGRVEFPGELPHGFAFVVRGSHAYAVVVNDLGVPQVVRYRLEGRTD